MKVKICIGIYNLRYILPTNKNKDKIPNLLQSRLRKALDNLNKLRAKGLKQRKYEAIYYSTKYYIVISPKLGM